MEEKDERGGEERNSGREWEVEVGGWVVGGQGGLLQLNTRKL